SGAMTDKQIDQLPNPTLPIADTDLLPLQQGGITVHVDVSSLRAGGGGDGNKGDITVSGNGSNYTINNGVVSYAKMQDISAGSRLLGRGDSGSGDPQEITIGSGLSLTGTTLSSTGGGGGADPLFLTQGLTVSGFNPTYSGDPNDRYIARFRMF